MWIERCWKRPGNDGGGPDGGGDQDPDADGAHATATAISARQDHVCVLLASGEVDCCGNGIFGKRELTTDVVRFPTEVAGLDGDGDGGGQGLAVRDRRGRRALLGRRHVRPARQRPRHPYSEGPTGIAALGPRVTAIAVGGSVSCAVASGRTWWWGAGGSASGSITKEGAPITTPARVCGF